MDFEKMVGLGVAGNFAHHLEQAKEAGDFVGIEVEEESAPKGIFPFYTLANSGHHLDVFPLSSTEIISPKEGGNMQMEPEVALICNVIYENGHVVNIEPTHFTAYNDCSIRKEGARKISEKKNWGESSKGISRQLIEIDLFTQGGLMDNWRIASFLKRNGDYFAYGEDSPMIGYSYFYEKLQKWIIDKMNNQKEQGPLENILEKLKASNYPKQMVISIGATAYTSYGETAFLEPNDEVFVVLYDASRYNESSLEEMIRIQEFPKDSISVLQQVIL